VIALIDCLGDIWQTKVSWLGPSVWTGGEVVRRATVFAVLVGLTCGAIASAEPPENRVSINLELKSCISNWRSTHQIWARPTKVGTDWPILLAREVTNSDLQVGPRLVVNSQWAFASGEILFGNYDYSGGGKARFRSGCVEFGAHTQVKSAILRGALGGAWNRADYTSLDTSHFVDHAVTKCMLSGAILSAPKSPFRMCLNFAIPVGLVFDLFGEKWGTENGSIVSAELTLGYYHRRSGLTFDAGYSIRTVQYPMPPYTWLETTRQGLVLKIGYQR
jgi:hypothetical protein